MNKLDDSNRHRKSLEDVMTSVITETIDLRRDNQGGKFTKKSS